MTEAKISAAETDLTLTFGFEVGKSAVNGRGTLAFMPVITDGEYKVSVEPILVRGKHAVIYDKHHKHASV